MKFRTLFLPLLVMPFLACKAEEQDTGWIPVVDTGPFVDYALINIVNESGVSIFHAYQCIVETSECYDGIDGTLVDGSTSTLQVDPGWWTTTVVDEYDMCRFSGEYQLFKGDEYTWIVQTMNAHWDGQVCLSKEE